MDTDKARLLLSNILAGEAENPKSVRSQGATRATQGHRVMDRSHGSGGGLGGGQPQSRGSEGQRMEVMPLCSGALMSPNVAACSPCSKYPKRFQQKWPPKVPGGWGTPTSLRRPSCPLSRPPADVPAQCPVHSRRQRRAQRKRMTTRACGLVTGPYRRDPPPLQKAIPPCSAEPSG